MHDKLKLLLDKIGLENEFYSYFNNGKLEKVLLNKQERKSCFVIRIDNTLPLEVFLSLKEKIVPAFSNESIKEVLVKLNIKDINYDLLEEYYKNIINSIPGIAIKIFLDNKIYYENGIKIEVLNIAEEMKLKEYIELIENKLSGAGFNSKIEIIMNKEKNDEIKKIIEEETKEIKMEKPDVVNNVILGTDLEGVKVNYEIKDIIGEDDKVVVECYIFGTDIFESSKSNFKILTLKISDNTDSIYCKLFTKDANEFANYCSKLKPGKWIKIRGYTKNDPFSRDLVLNARDIMEIPSKDVDIKDDAEVKRVELHAHTMMSQMDGVTKFDLNKHTCELASRAIKMGYRGVAITDHNGCQAFPVVYGIINDYNKKIEDKSKHFKGLYGVELTLVDDTVNIVVRPTDNPLLNNTYVVFDTETTGFNAAGGDQMIEIGAVKIKEGVIIDRFDELINPGRPIPPKITELTCITDDMVAGCDNEENVTKMRAFIIKL